MADLSRDGNGRLVARVTLSDEVEGRVTGMHPTAAFATTGPKAGESIGVCLMPGPSGTFRTVPIP